jgi:hypothetical protein
MLLFLAGGLNAATQLDQFVTPDQKDYQDAQDLRSRFGGAALPAAGSSRGDLVLALAGLATDAATLPPVGDWKMQDYDALYALLQKYRDELRSMGFSQKQLEDELAALKVRAMELKERLDKLQPKDGMKIHGKIASIYDHMMLVGPGKNSGETFRYAYGLTRAELDFSVTRGIFSGDVEFLTQRILGDMYSCTTCLAVVKSINVEIRTPLAFQAGDIDVKMTPLTVWRNEDEQPFEPQLFKDRRQSQLDELLLKPDALRLRGTRLLTDLVFFDRQKLSLEGVIVGLGLPGQTIYQRGTIATLAGDAPGSQNLVTPYSTFFGAWSAKLPIDALVVTYSGTIVKDALDTAIATYAGHRVAGFDSQVHSGQVAMKWDSLGLAVRAEVAESGFCDPNVKPDFNPDYLTGTAMTLSLSQRFSHLGVSLTVRDVSDNFLSSPAQGRTQDAEFMALGPFPTENSLFHPSQTGIGSQFGNIFGSTPVPEPPESHFNAEIVPPQVYQGTQFVAGYKPAFDYRINAIAPYGLATPNRSGARLDLDTNLFSEILKVMGTADYAVEKTSYGVLTPVIFLVTRGGAIFDLEPWLNWPFNFTFGYTLSDMRNTDHVAFTSTLVDLGLNWKAYKNMTVSLGGRHIDYNGTLPYGGSDPLKLAFGYVAYDQAYDLGGIGLNWAMNDDVKLRLNYSALYFTDQTDVTTGVSTGWQMGQGFAELSFVF